MARSISSASAGSTELAGSKQKYSMPSSSVSGSGTSAALQLLKFCTRPTETPGVWT